jgi:hypothetical protein
MVKGLNIFRDRFRQFEGSFTLIGGAACDQWFTAQGLPFRATKDLDIVLIIEVLAPEAIRSLRAFIADGQYEIRQRTEGSPVLYRFAKPQKEQYHSCWNNSAGSRMRSTLRRARKSCRCRQWPALTACPPFSSMTITTRSFKITRTFETGFPLRMQRLSFP